jgi:hypothetical protein
MGSLVHLHDRSPAARLDEIEAEVFTEIDRMCLRVGALLWEARELDRAGFRDWVETRLPFGFDRARRLIAIYLAYHELPEATVAQLPRPWQALYALRHWAGGRLEVALETGEIGPSTTVAQAKAKAREWSANRLPPKSVGVRYSQADLRAGALMGHDPDDLDDNVFIALSRWIARRQR